MPPTPSGAHTLTVTDGTSTSLLTFVMEATAPSVPRPLVPEESTRPSRPVRFDWKDVSDPSGVLYSLQVATDEKFEHIGLDKEDIAGSEYKLTHDENLKSVTKQTPYFWRVKAIDRAGNEGDWSEVNAFHLGFVLTLPNGETAWTMSALTAYIAGLVTMAAIGFTFWLGRRSVRRGAPVNPNNTPSSSRTARIREP
jgi:hypothetical protein